LIYKRLKLLYTNDQFKSQLKYALHLQNISYKIKENYLYYHRIDNKKVKKTNKKVIKNYNQITENCDQIVLDMSTPRLNYTDPIQWNYQEVNIPIYIDSNQSSPITELGVKYTYIYSNRMDVFNDVNYIADSFTLGDYTITVNNIYITYNDVDVLLNVYATNKYGTTYLSLQYNNYGLCLAEGTLITLSDRSYKPIENITYDDELLVWDFDEGKFNSAKPCWIMKPKMTSNYNLSTFSDGSKLKTIVQHRIFNKQAGKFTYITDQDSPIGTITFNNHGQEVCLISKEIINENVNYYNIITDYHINLFSSHILTSSRYNNIYPIDNMKFIKTDVNYIERSLFGYQNYGISEKLFNSLRIKEQPYTLSDDKIIDQLTKMNLNALIR